MKEEQNSELLEQIRKEAKVGLDIINRSLNSTTSEVVVVEGVTVERGELIEFKATLETVDSVGDIEGLEELLKEDAIPLDMLMESNSWDELQRLIFDLHDESLS